MSSPGNGDYTFYMAERLNTPFDAKLKKCLYRRSLRGDPKRKIPTPFQVHGLRCFGGVRSRIQSELYQGSWSSITSDEYVGNAPPFQLYADSPWLGSPSAEPEWSQVDRAAIDSFNNGIDRYKADMFNASVFAAEAGKSVNMILGSARRVSRALKAIRKGNLRSAYDALGARLPPKYRGGLPASRTVTKDAANYWLEARYGWLPLLSDAKNAAQKIADLVLDKPDCLRIVGRNQRTSLTQSAYNAPPNQGLVSSYSAVNVDLGSQYVATVTVGNQSLLVASSLGLTNPALVAWELVPLSFVLDWFLPIGEFLESISRFHGLSLKHGFQTKRMEKSWISSLSGLDFWYNYQLVDGVLTPTQRTQLNPAASRTVAKCVIRTVLTDFPTNSLQPDISLNWKKGITAAALLRQLVR